MHWLVRAVAAALAMVALASLDTAPASSPTQPVADGAGGAAVAQAEPAARPTGPEQRRKPTKPHPSRTRRQRPAKPDISAYRGLGTWVDVHDERVYRRPRAAVRTMRRRGVKTLYLETAHYNTRGRIHRPRAVARLIHAAHRRGLRVIAWYLPSFTDVERDFRRSRAAIRFTTPKGQRFDGFALDIESDRVRKVSTRNRRLFRLSRKIRSTVGPDYALGAIVPEAGARYWRGFPYEKVNRRYDVFLPMAYHTFRIRGRDEVERYARRNVRKIRTASRDRTVPVHMIGGLAERARPTEVRGFVKGSKSRAAVGVSLYDFDTMNRKQWRALSRRAAKGPKPPNRP